MALENKLGITDSAELAKAEERMSKTRAAELFENGLLDSFETGTFAGLAQIHKYLFRLCSISAQRESGCGSGCDGLELYRGDRVQYADPGRQRQDGGPCCAGNDGAISVYI